MRLQGFVQKDLKYHSVNVLVAFQGLRNYQRRRVPPRSTDTQAAGRNHPVSSKMETFTALQRNSHRQRTVCARMFLPSVFLVVRLLPWPFLKGNIHLQFLGYRKGAKYPTAPRAAGDWGIRAATAV